MEICYKRPPLRFREKSLKGGLLQVYRLIGILPCTGDFEFFSLFRAPLRKKKNDAYSIFQSICRIRVTFLEENNLIDFTNMTTPYEKYYRGCKITPPSRFQGAFLDTSPSVRNFLSRKFSLNRSKKVSTLLKLQQTHNDSLLTSYKDSL